MKIVLRSLLFSVLLLSATSHSFAAPTFSTVTTFTGAQGFIYQPAGPLFEATDGSVYGAGVLGGASNFGGVYKVTSSGEVTAIGSFTQKATPLGLVQAADGSLYGVAASPSNSPSPNGIFFKITTAGVMTTIPATFPGVPGSPIVVGSDGKFYGLTNTGGDYGLGTFYQILPSGNVGVICSLDSTMSISGPFAIPLQQLVVGKDKNFYGATPVAIFRISAPPTTPPVNVTPVRPVVLHSYSATGVGGAFGPTDLIASMTDGNIYGTSLFGGTQNQGFAFKMTPGGTVTNLLSFGLIQNVSPNSGFISTPITIQAGGPTSIALGHDGDTYVTANGGFGIDTNHAYTGVLLQLTPAGIRDVLFGSTPGNAPNSIIQATDGTLYGTTEMGGTVVTNGNSPSFSGTLYNINPGLVGGTIIGTAGTYNIKAGNNTIANVFDDNINTFFDAPSPGNGDWVGLDLGYSQSISAIAFVPRTNYEVRMIGGVFQGANSPDFSDAVNLAPPITAFPGDRFNTLIIQPIAVGPTYRYVRYLSPDKGFGNINEMQIFSDGMPPHSGAGG